MHLIQNSRDLREAESSGLPVLPKQRYICAVYDVSERPVFVQPGSEGVKVARPLLLLLRQRCDPLCKGMVLLRRQVQRLLHTNC